MLTFKNNFRRIDNSDSKIEYCPNGIYSPALPTTKEGIKLLAEAGKRNLERDKTDHESGYSAPPDGNILEYLRNAMSAIGSGIDSKDLDSRIAWECVAEGMAMLFDVESRMRSQLPHPLEG